MRPRIPLANLTSITPSYCQLVLEEGGLHLMEEIIRDYTDKSQVKNWAVVVRSNVLNWQQSN